MYEIMTGSMKDSHHKSMNLTGYTTLNLYKLSLGEVLSSPQWISAAGNCDRVYAD